jgi:maltoporin
MLMTVDGVSKQEGVRQEPALGVREMYKWRRYMRTETELSKESERRMYLPKPYYGRISG